MDPLSDNSLMLKVKNGDLSRMSLLFERYHKQLFGYLFHQTGSKMESDDLVQTTFYLMLKYKHTFSETGEFRAWMYQLARNAMILSDKKNKRMEYKSGHEQFENQLIDHKLEQEFEQKESKAQLENALAKMPIDQREVLILSRYQELPYREIAKIMNISEANVKVKVFRAIQELKKLFLKNN